MVEEEKEYWKRIEGYQKGYYISNKGRVWNDRIKKYVVISKDGFINIRTPRGYRTAASMGRLMGEAFVPNPHHYSFIRMLDPDKGWMPDNLAWVQHGG